MKIIIVAAIALVAVASALPVEDQKQVEVVSSDSEQKPEGDYAYSYKLSDGSKRKETGTLKEVLDEDNKPRNVIVVRGSFRYLNSDGTVEKIKYSADETGYHAEGRSIPVAPLLKEVVEESISENSESSQGRLNFEIEV